jgi:hypothetical protein
VANVVRDPKTYPEAILPDLTKSDPLVKFTWSDNAFVYGSKWKQRYFTKKGEIIFLSRHDGILRAKSGAPMWRPRKLIGGCLSTDGL